MSADAALSLEQLITSRKKLEHLLGSRADVDDVMQTVRAKLVTLDTEPGPAYLHTMLRNAAVDKLRADTTRRNYEHAYAATASVVDASTPEDKLAGLQAIEALNAAIAELNPLSQEIFLRGCVDEQPRAEIAEALGLRLSTIEKRLAKAKRFCLARVRQHLKQG
ncbi:MAG: sigma-70 family RNA polymerase sigma factor [Pseudomonadota bacterium]